MRRLLSALIVVVVVVAGVVAFRAWRAGHQVKAPVYSLAAARYGPLSVDVTGSGTVQAATSVNVNPQEPGTVTDVTVEVGSHVKAGQVLADVSDPQGTLRGNLLSAEAQLAADQASLSSLVSPTPPSAAEIRADQQRVQVDQTKIQTDGQNLQDLTVTAPSSGAIASVSVGIGQQVGAGTPLVELVQPNDVQVSTSVPEIDLPNIYTGEGVQVWTQDQGNMNAVVGSVGVAASGSNRQGALFPVILTIENPPTGLRQGMQATVNFTEAYLSTAGTVNFANAEAVPAQVSGTVETVPVQPGQTVQAGQTLLTLSNPALATQLAADQAQLAADQATLLQLQNPTPPQPDQVASAKARIAADEESVSRAQLALTQLNIVSPIDGIVTAVNIQDGDSVTSGQAVTNANSSSTTTTASTAAFAVEDPHSLQVLVPVSEISIAEVHIGQPVTVTADALPGQTFAGTVAQISPSGVSSQGVSTFNVIIDIKNPGKLLAGMSASVDIRVARVGRALLVPVEAVTGSGSQATVQVMQNGKIAVRHVETGLSNDVSAQILSGLQPGTEVVTAQAAQSTLIGGGPGFGHGPGAGGNFRRLNGSGGQPSGHGGK